MADRRRKEDAEATPAADRRKAGRRAAPRMPVSLWAVEDDGSGIYYHHVSDLSPGGLFLENRPEASTLRDKRLEEMIVDRSD